MDISDLRIALFSGNYNYTRDGANQALNRLVGSLLAKGAKVRVYSPKVAQPDFEPTGDLVGVPNIRMPIKGRGEYRLSTGLGRQVRQDLQRFEPNIMHLASPDPACHAAADTHGLPGILRPGPRGGAGHRREHVIKDIVQIRCMQELLMGDAMNHHRVVALQHRGAGAPGQEGRVVLGGLDEVEHAFGRVGNKD